MGVWIETPCDVKKRRATNVTPFVGVWIETGQNMSNQMQQYVTPFVGVWIETYEIIKIYIIPLSHPSWVCGLKHHQHQKEQGK